VNILTDQHHADLLYGLQRLFTDRLGYALYVPKGHEWWDSGIWQFGRAIADDDRLARQYLDLDSTYREVDHGVWVSFDHGHPERPIYGVTLPRAREMDWAAVMCSVQENQPGFHALAGELGARYLYHIGNARQQVSWDLEPLVLNAAEAPMEGRGTYIAQEFDIHSTFRYVPPLRRDRIVSFVNLLPLIPECWEPLENLRKLTGWECRSFGHSCPDGNLHPVAHVADEMSRAGFAYHDKPTGDGFGHIIHNWAAVGRPLIGHARYYAGQRAEPLWEDGVTCIDLDRHSEAEAAEIITSMSAYTHERMCEAIRERLESIVDFGNDARKVRELIA
jgi:hypothetical protein